MTIQNLAFLFISLLGALLSLFFFIRKFGDKFLNRLIALYTLLFSHEMFVNCLRWANLHETPEFVHFNLSRAPVGLIYGPLVYIYVRRVFTHAKFKKTDIFFLVPPLVVFLLCSPFYFIPALEKAEIVMSGRMYDYILLPDYTIWVIIAFMFGYALFAFMKFRKNYKIGLKELIWLKCFVGSYLGFVVVFSTYIFLIRFDVVSSKYYFIVDSLITIFILLVSYFGIVQPNVFDEKKSLRELFPLAKYRKTGLKFYLSKQYKEKLVALMNENKPYLNSDLRLNDIAESLNVTRNQASQIINEHFNKSFFDYINQQRIEASKNLLLQNDEKLNIEQIAYSVGFNNRASFYKAFKKFTNLTPKAFILSKKM